MRTILLLAISFSLVMQATASAEDKLLQQSDFTYLGAFRVPKSDMGGPLYQGLVYGGSVIAYNSANNSLFIVGHDRNQQVAEIGIPEIVNSTDINALKEAKIIQNLYDITEGNLLNVMADGGPIPANGTKIGGLLRYGDKLIGSIYAYYDGGYNAVRSHFTSGLSFSTTGDFQGIFEVGNKPIPVPQAGFVAGYMTPIPANWQTALGGKVLTGMSCLAILGRTSSGSAAFAFDPDQLGASAPAPASALLYYTLEHPTIGDYYTSGTLYNKGTHHSGVVFPIGSRSVVYTGWQGLGEACYGPGTNRAEEHGNRYNFPPPNNTCMGVTMTDTTNPCCYDPLILNKGPHAYPYAYYTWAYDAKDLARVKAAGRIADDPSPNLVDGLSPTSTETYRPWHIKPYAHWQMTFPYKQNGFSIFSGASAYDEISKRLYVVQVQSDTGAYANWPIIHVYKVNITPTPVIKNINMGN